MKKHIAPMLLGLLLVVTAVAFSIQAAETDPAVVGQQVAAAALALENSTFKDATGVVTADCPICGSEESWTPLTNAIVADGEKLAGGHYYMAENAPAMTSYIIPSGSETVCLLLNGKAITSSTYALYGYTGILNVMGSGEVKGGEVNAAYGAAVQINTAATTGAVNLYGGTYSKTDPSSVSNVVAIQNNGGAVNIYAGATIIAGSQGAGIYIGNTNKVSSVLGIYGGVIDASQSSGSAINVVGTVVPTNRPAVVNMSGGAVIGGTGGAMNLGNGSSRYASLNLSGGTVTGAVNVTATASVTLSGAPVVTGAGLQVAEGEKIALGEMTGGASVVVSASGTFTEVNEKASDYAKYFKAADTGAQIIVQESALFYWNQEVNAENSTAICPVCGTEETWIAITEGGQTISEAGHYYLADSISYTGSNYGLLVSGGTACLHLNGKNLTATKVDAIRHTAGVLNIIGSGNVAGNSTNTVAAHGAATLNVRGNDAVMNLYGGAYGISGTSGNAIANVNGYYGGTLNLYDGAVIGGADIEVFAVRAYWGSFNMFGGKIIGGTMAAVSSTAWNKEKVGAVNMHGGEIVAGTGGAVVVSGAEGAEDNALFNMTGGTISGSDDAASKVELRNACSAMTMSGGVILGAETAAVRTGTAINITAGTLTLSGTASVYNAAMQGNIYVASAGSLSVDEGWTGKASVAFEDIGAGYGVTVANGESTGDYTGTLIYDYNHMKPNIYGVDGKLVISGVRLYLADGTLTWPKSNADAVEKNIANPGSYIRVTVSDTTFQLPENAAVTIDFNGKTAKVTGNGTLCGMDGDNDTYAASSGAATVAETVTVQTDVTGGENGYRYIALTENGVTTFHRLDVKITTVSLRPTAAGLYYKAAYSCDSTLAGKVSAYGVVLSVRDMPNNDFVDVASDRFSYLNSGFEVSEENNYTVTATSGSVFGIFKNEEDRPATAEKTTAQLNAEYGKMKIYANAYIMVDTQNDGNTDNDLVLVGDTANAGKQAGVAYSLFDALKAIDDNWASYEAAQTKVTDFYDQWKDLGMSQWADEFTNIA